MKAKGLNLKNPRGDEDEGEGEDEEEDEDEDEGEDEDEDEDEEEEDEDEEEEEKIFSTDVCCPTCGELVRQGFNEKVFRMFEKPLERHRDYKKQLPQVSCPSFDERPAGRP